MYRTNQVRFVTPEAGDLRFTQTLEAFYVISLTEPASPLIIDVPLPILAGDTISMIGAANGTQLAWSFTSDGSVSIEVPSLLIESGKYAWAFKVAYLA
jgi:alpha-L-fucosidase